MTMNRPNDDADKASRVLAGFLSLLDENHDEGGRLTEEESLAATELRAALDQVKKDHLIEEEKSCVEEALRKTRRSLESSESVRDCPVGAIDDGKRSISDLFRDSEKRSRGLIDGHEQRVRAAKTVVAARSGLVFASAPSETLDDCVFDAIFDLDDDGYRFIVCTSP